MAEQDESMRFEERRVDIGEVSLNVVEKGNGPLVVLLHGFPEFWGSWRRQLTALADAGFRAVAPDMRGYHKSDKPKGVHAYHLDRLTSDVASLIRALGEERAAAVVGHDWGGIVAWRFAMDYPEMLERLVILNVPHPVEMEKGLRTLEQLKKSYYVFLFQVPGLSERLIPLRDFYGLRRAWKQEGVAAEDIERLVQALRTTGRLTGPINYYRSSIRSVVAGQAPAPTRIEHPVLVVWGERDAYLGREMARPSAEWVPNARVEMLPEASHWVQLAAPARVNQLLVEFLREGRPYQGREAATPAGQA